MENWVKNSTTSIRLQEIMKERNIKQAELARLTGISRGAVSNYVLGRYEPKSDIINKFAKALNCSEMWLWGYDVPKQRREILSSVDLQLFGGSEPQSPALTEDEELLLKLFRQMPEDTQKMYLEVLRAHLKK
jgi:transcriptional regulator with XRE-family HTH domain